jgi:hypothetical protein
MLPHLFEPDSGFCCDAPTNRHRPVSVGGVRVADYREKNHKVTPARDPTLLGRRFRARRGPQQAGNLGGVPMSGAIFSRDQRIGSAVLSVSVARGKFLNSLKACAHTSSVMRCSPSFSTRCKSSAMLRHRSGTGGLMGRGSHRPSTKMRPAKDSKVGTKTYGFTAGAFQAIAADA